MTYLDCVPNSSVAEMLAAIVCRSANVRLIKITRVTGREPLAFVWKDTLVVSCDLRTLSQRAILEAVEKGLVLRGE